MVPGPAASTSATRKSSAPSTSRRRRRAGDAAVAAAAATDSPNPSNKKRKSTRSTSVANNSIEKSSSVSQKRQRKSSTKRNSNSSCDSKRIANNLLEDNLEQPTTSSCGDASASMPTSLIPDGLLPSYLADAFGDLYSEDGLVVLGKGLGWLSLLASFVRFYGDVEEGHVALQLEEEQERQHREQQQQQSYNENTNTGRNGSSNSNTKPPLVFVIGLREVERTTLISILETWGTTPEILPTIITNESGQGKDRAVMYQRGGVFVVTSRILIVDILTNVANAKDIDGILVAHAENVNDQSTEAFILRIFHGQKCQYQNDNNNIAASKSTKNQSPKKAQYFIKAFSDSPDALVTGFAKTDKVLKALRVRRIFLYPRFHESIQNELEGNVGDGTNNASPHVDEMYQELSPLMKEIQNALAALIQSCIREIKNTTNLLQFSNDEHAALNDSKSGGSNSKDNKKGNSNSSMLLSVENCVTSNFDYIISKQLEHDWHRIKPTTKQLIADLKQLRTLFMYLIQYDCISFWKLINAIKTNSSIAKHPSMWLLTPAADLLFRKAKERIYTIRRGTLRNKQQHRDNNGNSVSNPYKPVARLVPVLEETPKWKLLKQVLKEIAQEEKEKQAAKENTANNITFPTNVLVMVKDERTLDGILSYLKEGKKYTMTKRWLNYLDRCNDRLRSIAKDRGASGIPEESRLLLEEEGRVRNLLFNKNGTGATGRKRKTSNYSTKKPTTANSVPDYVLKRRRIATEKARGTLMHQADDLERDAVLLESVEKTEQEMIAQIDDDHDRNQNGNNYDDDDENLEDVMFEVSMTSDLRVILKSYSSIDGDQSLMLLQDIKPKYIVLYDSDVSFIRATEVFSSLQYYVNVHQQRQRLRVFFLIFEASAEEKIFMKTLDREQNAFEKLIHYKKTMPPPVLHNLYQTQEMQQAGAAQTNSYMGGALPLAFDTRTGKGKAKDSAEMRDVAVDVREFRSALPSILHQGGMHLAPVTLAVGDFVLSSVHCVERKSISDLFGSLNSGRLYTQAEAMCKYYKCPCLLIEFDPNKSFCLQNSNELGVEIRTDSICSKMALVTMHFPKLRILWSRSPHHTLQIFKDLKKNHEEVDVDKAVEIGRSETVEALLAQQKSGAASADNKEDEDEEDEINDLAREMLLRLPGVTIPIARRIMNECDSLLELSDMPREKLRKIAGPITGQKLFTFFRQKMQAT